MSAPPSSAAATEALTIGRASLQQLHDSLLRDAPDLTVPVLQEVGFAAGAGVFQAFCVWLPAETGVARPDDLDAGRLNDVLSAFFQATGWGSVSVARGFLWSAVGGARCRDGGRVPVSKRRAVPVLVRLPGYVECRLRADEGGKRLRGGA